ncbi:hypothetical protein [Flavobacterium sp.]|jgi:hypothetical protein|uniref:hypothetical protein n=1 Tax=Flavobacterium sp. TaxID=239 RepID=UPI002A800BB4|nr:hypothetical protein [Flavobacterium sp.]
MSSKKITKIEGADEQVSQSKGFVPTEDSKGKATQLRMFAALSWLGAIGAQIGAILLLFKPPVNMTWVIVLIVVDLAFAILGSYLWKKSNRLDPASEKNKFMFFMQSQLGLVVAIIAFLPLVIFVFTSKNLDGKQKGIIGGIAAVALVIAGIAGTDFNPPSVEQYTEQTEQVEGLNNGVNHVFWTKSGKSFHLFQDCGYINSDRTTEIFQGTVAQARELKNITDLCDRCGNKAKKNQETESVLEAPAIEEISVDAEAAE